ncbi:RecE family exodeoxyribonuclease [Pseudescherichia sp.]|uniref:RecE family exodeoxyribonuclease n=1 Tax=Pseudescherichia sp. TaxID=2055881 RepID=UPI0028A7F252|nr:RecE family exodeoxyribonuclease [Pseudescherichia sp.]
MEFFYLIKATQKSGKPDGVIWFSAKSEARAALTLDVKLEDADIETGRGKDYAKPIRTDFPVFNDLPGEGTVDYTWCERYELQEDGRTWLPKAGAEPNEVVGNTTAPVTTVKVETTDESVTLENRTPAVRFAFHLTSDKYQTHITKEQQQAASEMSLDEGNTYLHNLLLAKNDIPEIAELSLNAEWKLVQAIKQVFAPDEGHEVKLLAAFMSDWARADAGGRNHLAEEWIGGKLSLLKSENTSNAGVATDQDLVADEGIQIGEHDDEHTRYPVCRMPFRKQLLSQLTANELRHHLTRSEHAEITALEMDTDNGYVQNLLLVAEHCAELKTFDTARLWVYTSSIKDVFNQEKRHELSVMLQFTQTWLAVDNHGDREALVREWAAGNRVSTSTVDEAPPAPAAYKRAVAQNMANLSIEIAIALLFPDAVPGQINRTQLMAAKELADQKKDAHVRAFKVLGKTTDILDYNANSIFGVTRAIPWIGEETTTELRGLVRDWFTACGVYENGERSKGYPEWDENSRSFRHEKVEEPATTSQPQVANLGGGMFSIDGLLGENANPVIKTPSNEVAKQEVEIVGNVQMEETDPSKVEAGAEVSAVEGDDAAAAQADSLNPSEVLAAAVPELANTTQPEVTTEAPESEPQESIPGVEFPAYFEPGRYEGLPNNVYHAANGISSTMVKDARVSLMFYHGRHVTKTIRRESSEALTFGSLAHTLALEPEKLNEEFAVFPGVPEKAFTTTDSMKAFIREFNADKPKAEQLKLTGKKEELQAAIRAVNPDAIFADEFEQQWRDSVASKTILSSEQLALATAIQQALLNHESAGKLLRHPSRSVETSYFGMDDETGLEVRVRPDLEVEINGVRIGVDLKTISMGRVKQDGLRTKLHREIIDRDYHLSAGMYCAVADFDQFFWIFVNKDEGYHWVAVIEASEDLLALGMQEYQKTMRALAQAYDTNCWPAPITEDYTDELNDFDLRRLEALRTQA